MKVKGRRAIDEFSDVFWPIASFHVDFSRNLTNGVMPRERRNKAGEVLRELAGKVVISKEEDELEHAEFDESNTHVLERFYTSAGNPVKEILLKLNLPDHRKLKDGGEVKEFHRSFRHSDTECLSRSDEVLKLKNFKKDATFKAFSSNQSMIGMSTCLVKNVAKFTQDGKAKMRKKEIMLG
ncbi:hypothetical protein Tco_1158419 [Tanacetum coccineum]